MPLFAFEGKSPQVHPEAWVAPTATLIGDVVVEAGASLWGVVHGAVVGAEALIGACGRDRPGRLVGGDVTGGRVMEDLAHD
jgi:carbonic anhydrase/acetyltransferase-like protein (isoleucine patch superfamily)